LVEIKNWYTFALSLPHSVNASLSIVVRISRFIFIMELIFVTLYFRCTNEQNRTEPASCSQGQVGRQHGPLIKAHTHADRNQTGTRKLSVLIHVRPGGWHCPDSDMIDMTLLRFSHGRDTLACALNFLQPILSLG